MKKVENFDKILYLMKLDETSESRLKFIEKYSTNSELIYWCLDYNFSKWLKGEIDILNCALKMINSNLEFNIDNYSIWEVVIEYLKLHLYLIKDLIDENPDELIRQLEELKIKEEKQNNNFGARHVSKELSDGIFNPFDKSDLIIDEIVNVFNIKFKNNEIRNRFYDVCVKFIRNVRNKFQTFDILIKYKKGIGLEKNIADKVLEKIEEIKKEKEEFLLENHKENISIIGTRSSLPEIEGKVEDLEIEGGDLRFAGIIGENNNVEANGRSPLQKQPIAPVQKESIKEPIIKEYDEKDMKFHFFDGSIEEMYLNQIKNKEEVQEVSVGSDIYKKYINSKLVGPIEELALFTIRDFRNLDGDIQKRIDKIEQKIKVLASYSARKKILGIKAWLLCEVCTVYKQMIDEGVKYGDINKVINIRKENGEFYLTQEEINGISQLNRKLRI